MDGRSDSEAPLAAQAQFGVGLEDVVIVPLAMAAVVVRKLLRATLRLLINILDYAFPILLQLVRFPLFTLRIAGDGIAALLKGVVRFLPLPGTRRDRVARLSSAPAGPG